MEITEAARRHCVEEGNFANCADCRDVNRWTRKTNECESVLKAIALEDEARYIETADALRDLQAAAKKLAFTVVPLEPNKRQIENAAIIMCSSQFKGDCTKCSMTKFSDECAAIYPDYEIDLCQYKAMVAAVTEAAL